MKPEEFIVAIQQNLVKHALSSYRDVLRDTPRKKVKDRKWQPIFTGWDSMNDRQRDAALRFVRLAIVDTISHIFGILDNISALERYRDGFVVMYGDKMEKLNGDLQDHFLRAEEEEPSGL